MKKTIYKVKDMHCASCALLIEGELEDAGIKAKCSFAKQTLEIEEKHDLEEVKEAVKKAGYTLQS